MSRERSLPTGRLARVVRLAGVGARAGAGLLLSKNGANAAGVRLGVLGTCGSSRQVGPVDTGRYRSRAQRETTTRPSANGSKRAPFCSDAIARLITRTGAPVTCVQSFDEEPFASASIGQVHRATLLDGRIVAVKVQHPGIASAIESDLKNAGLMEGLISSLGPKGLNAKAAYDEVATRFREELDYALEARRQRQFAEMHAGDPTIRIPGVIPERSSRRVLTTELVEGLGFEAAAAASESERVAWAETLGLRVQGTWWGLSRDPPPRQLPVRRTECPLPRLLECSRSRAGCRTRAHAKAALNGRATFAARQNACSHSRRRVGTAGRLCRRS